MTSTRTHSWQDIRAQLRTRISDGTWPPGELIPGEALLAEEFGCSRTTVNRALRELAATGIIDRKRKAGTRVAEQRARRAVVDIPVIRVQVEEQGHDYDFRILTREQLKPPRRIAELLKLRANSSALHVRTVHLAGGKPFIFEDRWVNTRTVPQILKADLDSISVNEWLVTNVPFSSGELVIRAKSAGKAVGKILGIDPLTPLLKLERLTWLEGRSVTAAELQHQPDQHITLQV